MQTAAEGEVEKSSIAYLTDRVRVNRGQPQIYGTQFTIYDNGEYGPRTIEDVENVDERRREMGIKASFEDYKKMMEESNRVTQERIKKNKK